MEAPRDGTGKMIVLHTRFAAIAVGLLVLLMGATPGLTAETSLSPPLSAQGYVQLGVPAPDHPWTSAEFKAAFHVVNGLGDEQLPRPSNGGAGFCAHHEPAELCRLP